MAITITERRASNFAAMERKCMNCGEEIIEANDLYSRRFCSVKCKQEYCEELGEVKTV